MSNNKKVSFSKPRSFGLYRNRESGSYTVGQILNRQREQLGFSIEDVAYKSAEVNPSHCIALEKDDWQYLGSEIDGRKRLQAYGEVLNLDPLWLVEQRRKQLREMPPVVSRKPWPTMINVTTLSICILLLGSLFVLLVAQYVVADPDAEKGSAPIPNIISTQAESQASGPTRNLVPTFTPTVQVIPKPTVSPTSTQTVSPTAVPIVDPTDTPTPVPTAIPTFTPTARATSEQTVILFFTQTAIPTMTPTTIPTLVPTVIPAAISTSVQTIFPTVGPTATDVPAPSLLCIDPHSAILSPRAEQVVAGIVDVQGTAFHENIQYYKLELVGNGDGEPYFLTSGGRSVVDGFLGRINTQEWPNGNYKLRITVVDNTGNFAKPCDIPVDINNTLISR